MVNTTGAKGAGNQAAGSIKEAAGKVFGSDKLEAEGKIQKTKGKIQSGIGNVQDAVE